MTEAEWLACTNPEPMLLALGGRASERKLRLFACACCRRAWHLLTDERSRTAVEVAERFADGYATREELGAASEAAGAAWNAAWEGPASEWFEARDAEWTACVAASPVARAGAASAASQAWDYEPGARADLLRDIFPVRLPALDPAWLAWNDGTVPKLARGIYDGRAFDRLPILADALEEAGCADAELLHHCRQPSEHVRGCWVIDLLTGRA
jgi:hypothetical protein